MPPLLSLAASPTLVSELGELLHRLQARRRRLMAMRRESNARWLILPWRMFPVLAAQRAEQLNRCSASCIRTLRAIRSCLSRTGQLAGSLTLLLLNII
ncbi:type VI secretion system baseplate subunit TssK [Klebsiella pneumoniae]|uniref:Type VI secretion system baseplate subunit TssK n=1 Tax=Klebsiella pneumoniae TaxID=573 RepID=A0A939NSH9_KLEPN|nr:type VI secretion system baseplate subunit TssK [Klebsiella pneumoniae]